VNAPGLEVPGLDGGDPREAEVAAVFHAYRQHFVRLAWHPPASCR